MKNRSITSACRIKLIFYQAKSKKINNRTLINPSIPKINQARTKHKINKIQLKNNRKQQTHKTYNSKKFKKNIQTIIIICQLYPRIQKDYQKKDNLIKLYKNARTLNPVERIQNI